MGDSPIWPSLLWGLQSHQESVPSQAWTKPPLPFNPIFTESRHRKRNIDTHLGTSKPAQMPHSEATTSQASTHSPSQSFKIKFPGK